jgi:hypothetical protein
MHARAYEIIVKSSATQPFCNDVIFQHPSRWRHNNKPEIANLPHVEGMNEAKAKFNLGEPGGAAVR